MRVLLILAALASCLPRRPLEPGETKCTQRGDGFGGTVTDCRTGQPKPPDPDVEPHASTSGESDEAAELRRERQATPPPRDSGPPVIYVDGPLWCRQRPDPAAVVNCYFDNNKAFCGEGCAQFKAASCFILTSRMDDTKSTLCFDQVAGCESMRAQAAVDPGYKDVSPGCGIARWKAAFGK